VFAVYTQSNSPASIETAYQSISPYFDGSYFTGTSPPIAYSYWPFAAVIDMRNGEVIATDSDTAQLSPTQLIEAVSSAGD
jgi:hypothetical protein